MLFSRNLLCAGIILISHGAYAMQCDECSGSGLLAGWRRNSGMDGNVLYYSHPDYLKNLGGGYRYDYVCKKCFPVILCKPDNSEECDFCGETEWIDNKPSCKACKGTGTERVPMFNVNQILECAIRPNPVNPGCKKCKGTYLVCTKGAQWGRCKPNDPAHTTKWHTTICPNCEGPHTRWIPVKVNKVPSRSQEYGVETLSEVECEENGFKFILEKQEFIKKKDKKRQEFIKLLSCAFNSPEADLRLPVGQRVHIPLREVVGFKCRLTAGKQEIWVPVEFIERTENSQFKVKVLLKQLDPKTKKTFKKLCGYPKEADLSTLGPFEFKTPASDLRRCQQESSGRRLMSRLLAEEARAANRA